MSYGVPLVQRYLREELLRRCSLFQQVRRINYQLMSARSIVTVTVKAAAVQVRKRSSIAIKSEKSLPGA
jgi:hypothetical protein